MDNLMLLSYLFIFIIGASIGSFLNVCIHRLPGHQSIITPASHCPDCKAPIRFYDYVPILSYLLLRGRCRVCGNPISIQYISVEVINGAAYVLITWKFGLSAEPLFYARL